MYAFNFQVDMQLDGYIRENGLVYLKAGVQQKRTNRLFYFFFCWTLQESKFFLNKKIFMVEKDKISYKSKLLSNLWEKFNIIFILFVNSLTSHG